MTMIPIQLPFGGFTEQTQFSNAIPGMTQSCLNVMPSDPWNGRARIGTRTGTLQYNLGAVQFMSTFRAYQSGVLVEKIIFVRAGKVYFADPNAAIPVSSGTMTSQVFANQSTALLNTTGLVEGVQFNEHFYFVDGTHYVYVSLTGTTGAFAWGQTGGGTPHGPAHLDPATTAGNRATLICRWGARLVLAGFKVTPNLWFACAPDQPYPDTSGGTADGWDGTEFIGAIGGGTVKDYGSLGSPIVAIFPFAQTGLMFGCTDSFSFLTSDPVFDSNASIVNMTNSIGIAGQRAFCQSQEKGAFVLGNDGLYALTANDFNFNRGNRVSAGRLDSFFLRLDFGTPAIGGSSPLAGGTFRSLQTDIGSTGATNYTKLSDGSITDSAQDTDTTINTNASALIGNVAFGEVFPSLCYDPDREGVWIFLAVSGADSASLHLFYDLKTNSFWPQRFSDPMMYDPTSSCYVGTARSHSGKLFFGNDMSISLIDKDVNSGIDGYDSEGMTEVDQRAKFVKSSMTFGPFLAPLPYRYQLNELRVDLAQDRYELPITDYSVAPVVSVSSGSTAQEAIGLQTDVIFVVNLNALVIDCGEASSTVFASTYDGGGSSDTAPANNIDGRLAIRPFGTYTQTDLFASGIFREYNGPGDWVVRWQGASPIPSNANPSRWTVARKNPTNYEVDYEQIVADEGSPDGSMVTVRQLPIAPDAKDNTNVSAASFPNSTVTEIGELNVGRNEAMKCRIRSEAMYITIGSNGHPWAVERVSASFSQVGKSRGSTP